MKDIVNRYIEGLEKAYQDNDGMEKWNEFVNVKEGASAENIARIKELYPEVPESLLELLRYADGTYFRTYGNTTSDYTFWVQHWKSIHTICCHQRKL